MTVGRVLRVLHTEASLGWGGQEIRILTEARRFTEMGHQVHLLCDEDSDIFSVAAHFGVAATAIPLKKRTVSGLRVIRRFLSTWQPDIVNCHSSVDHWLTAVARIGQARGPAVVRTRHISAPVSRNTPTRWLYNKGCESVMTTSRAMAGELTEDGFLRRDHVTAVPTGIDTDRFRPGDGQGPRQRVRLPESAFIFGIVATLRSWKGHSFLLEAFANIAPKDALLLIVGDGPREKNLMEQINSLGIQDQVRMAGRQDDVVPFLRAMDVFVLPSYKNEGVPQALSQAMACELSVIASQVGGIPELVDGLDAVRQVSPMDVQALGDAMTHAMAHRPDAASCKALRKRVTGHYTIDGMYDRALSVFEKSIKKRKSITSRTG